MSRLPQIGSDDGTWGTILNDFLSQAHDADGTLKSGSVTSASIGTGVVSEAKLDAGVQTKLNTISSGVADGAVTTAKLADGAVTAVKIPDATITETKLDSGVTAKLNAVGTVSDGAITTLKLADGAVTDVKINASAAIAQSKISGLTTALSGKEPAITAGTTGQYLRGDKSFQTLDKTAVGLANVDNTSDANKPVSSAAQTALNAKEATITAGTTAQYFRGDKSFQALDKTAVGLANVDNTSDVSKPISTATQSALDLKANASSIGPQFLVLGPTDTVPLGTTAGTVIVRTT